MKQFPRPMLEELHARRDALCAAEFPEGPQKDKGKPLPDPTARVDLAVPYADFFKQMSALEARSLSDLRAEAGGPVLHPEVAALRKEMGAYRYRAPGTSISAAEAGTVRAVPQEQWEAMRGALMAAQVELESLTLVFRAYEAHHLAKKTGDSDYKAGVNRAHATRATALTLRIQEALK